MTATPCVPLVVGSSIIVTGAAASRHPGLRVTLQRDCSARLWGATAGVYWPRYEPDLTVE